MTIPTQDDFWERQAQAAKRRGEEQERDKLREALAKKVAKGFRALKDIADDVRQLWAEFDALADGETIMDCHTKTEYCEKVLGRSMRSVQYMLVGGNHQRHETVSRTRADRRTKLFGEGCTERHAEEVNALRKKLSPKQVTQIEWAPEAPDPDSDAACGDYYEPTEDRYRLSMVGSKDEVEKVAVALGPEKKIERRQLLQEVIESLQADNAETTRVRFERFVEQLAKGLSLEEHKEQAA
jgi:hypothetical protein